MATLALLALGALLQGVASGSAASGDLGRLFVARDKDGPLLVVREQNAPPLIAIRLSVPVSEPPSLAGAGRVLQLLVENRARSEVERFGGELVLSRTPTHLVYAVRGPAAAFGEMVAVLKYAVAPPLGIATTQSAIWVTARQEALADFETPERLLRQRLEAILFPELAPLEAAPELQRLPSAAQLEWFWRRWFRPERFAVVVVGAISPEQARAAFRGWPVPPRTNARPPGSSSGGGEPPRLEVIGVRTGLGYPGGATQPAALAIAAALIDEALPALGLRQATSELWWMSGRTALVVMGAAPPSGPGAPFSLTTTLQLAVAGAASRTTTADLERVRHRLRHSLLMRARTPGGMADVIGEFLDRTGDPQGANDFLVELSELDDDDIRSTLRTLVYRSPLVVELAP